MYVRTYWVTKTFSLFEQPNECILGKDKGTPLLKRGITTLETPGDTDVDST